MNSANKMRRCKAFASARCVVAARLACCVSSHLVADKTASLKQFLLKFSDVTLGDFLGLRDFFKKPPQDEQDEVVGAKVLVAALDPKFTELLNADSQLYTQFYRATTVMDLQTIDQLFATIETGYDIVHLLCDVSEDGHVTDGRGNKMIGTALLQKCCDSNVKLLWLASDIRGGSFTAGFRPAGKRLNVAFTIDRKGPKFAAFLQKLLSAMSTGKTIPASWVSIVSLNPKDPRHKDLPDTALVAGRGGVILR